jgi:hypothetical protein
MALFGHLVEHETTRRTQPSIPSFHIPQKG